MAATQYGYTYMAKYSSPELDQLSGVADDRDGEAASNTGGDSTDNPVVHA